MTLRLDAALDDYIKEILSQYSSGQAREHGYRPAFERLMRSFEDVGATNDPKRSEYGNPDLILYKQSNPQIILGYAEAKDITVNLDKVISTDQLNRYAGYEKLFLTNYLEFRFFRNGEEYERVSIGKVENNKVVLNRLNFAHLIDELQNFISLPPESIKSGKKLAIIMGGKARRIRDNVSRYLRNQGDTNNTELEKIYELMKKMLVHDMTKDKFADMYSQTLVYGLFVARYSDKSPEDFSRREAVESIPKSNPFLRNFFNHIAGADFDSRLAYVVDELCDVLRVSNVEHLISKHLRLFEQDDEMDPIIHFYEDFLKEYDPDERKKMGAYYTPVPIVRFIIREVDKIIKNEFGLSQGLSDNSKIVREIDHGQMLSIRNQNTGRLQKTSIEKREYHRVQILDPAIGTATFLNETIKFIHKGFLGQQGRWPAYVNEHLLRRLHGFELMVAPYTVAHLKLAITLHDTGVENITDRLGVYLTNTLEEGIPSQPDLFSTFGIAGAVTEESRLASEIKHVQPVMIVLGNPPYSGVSSNETDYANKLVDKYKVEPGGRRKLQERKHWLNDDYVKFIAFAEDMINKNDSGVVAMITNNGYLDNPTFRGMRWHLAKTFDSIYVLDLHGNAKKKETAPDGSKDENVFNIMQGVGIIMAVKSGTKTTDLASIYHAELYGKRSEKFKMLAGDIEFKKITPDAKYVHFIPRDTKGQEEYDRFIDINELFKKSSSGILTARDRIVLDFDKEGLEKRMLKFSDLSVNDDNTRSWMFPGKKDGKYLAGDSRGWQLSDARKAVASQDISENIKKIKYRPFDERYLYYVPEMVDWGRFDVMQNYVLGKNVGLLYSRMTKGKDFAHIQVTDKPSEVIYLSPLTGTNAFNAPLYIYHEDGTRDHNFKASALKALTTHLTDSFEPIDILDYIYAVLHSPVYRKTYKEFLKVDFPKVPPPKNDFQFRKFVKLGHRLRLLHLFEASDIDGYETTFLEMGSDEVEDPHYKEGRVYINQSQYFGNVPDLAWNFYIGGYQPAQKWLKVRKGRKLSDDDIIHYQRIIRVILETSKVMQEIDQSLM